MTPLDDEIESLRQRVQELAGYKEAWVVASKARNTAERALVESQAREAKLREALKLLMSAPFDYPDDEYQQDALASAMSNANTLLNQKQDDSALQEALKQVRTEDDPELDATDYAHPAWWRGHEYTTKVFCNHVNDILDGKDNGEGANNEPWGSTRKRLLVALKQARREALLEAADELMNKDIDLGLWLQRKAEEQK